jgi:signal peptidase I
VISTAAAEHLNHWFLMTIVQAFRSRRPTCAALIGLLFGPDVVMAYLGRGWLAISYFVGGLIFITSQMWLLGLAGMGANYSGVLIAIIWRVIGAAHGFLAARNAHIGPYPWYSHWYSLLLIFLVLSSALAFVVRGFLFQPFTIPASSMSPTVQLGDYLFASKYAYGYSRYSLPMGLGPSERIFGRAPDRGDVVVFHDPRNDTDYIKRVIGRSGDRVQLKAGIVYLNGHPLARRPEGEFNMGGYSARLFRESVYPDKSYLVAEALENSRGDNTAEFLVPPGHYFVLGDNRDNSLDSRFDMGFIPEENIFAKALWIFFNANQKDRSGMWVE